MNFKYKLSILGGTFDRFHLGHKKLLDTAFLQSEKIIIGIANHKLFKNKPLAHIIESFETRKSSIRSYLISQNFLERAEIISISDIYGDSLKNPNIEAVFATEKNAINVEKINIKRNEKGFKSLQVEMIPYITGDDSEIISSSRIRLGEIDRDGNSYFQLFTVKKKYFLPDEMRLQLKKPLGKVIKNIKQIEKFIQDENMLIAVGDITAINLFKIKARADISIIDYKTRRHTIDPEDQKILSQLHNSSNGLIADNHSGIIERRAVGTIKKSFNNYIESSKKQVILINGEEDLLTIPVILLSPLESVVIYGQPESGIVVVRITEKVKKQTKHILSKMR